MGVPKFYRWISERYPCLSEVVKEYQIPEFDNLYLDMNGIIHTCSHPNDDNPHFRITEEKIFADIFHYLEVLFRMIQPKKLFFMAVDGVAPRAKMNQQRSRRFRSAKEAELNEKKARDRGEDLPEEARFDSNCITPGTPFMVRLQEQLKYFVHMKISTDSLWRNTQVILSGHETPGEGEHKIMDYIRYQKSLPGYDPNTRHCLYGLDADLLMLGLCTHDPHFSLLREEVKFGGKKSQASKRTPTPEETTFHLLHLSLLREYIDYEFQDLKHLPFYNVENIIDDWVLMGFLMGNDFIPHLPHMHINKGGLPELYESYKCVLPKLGGYLNENGTLNLPRFEAFMARLSEFEMEKFDDIYSDAKWLEGKTARRTNGRTEVEATPGPGHVYEMLEGLPEPGVNQNPTPRNADLERLMASTLEFESSDSESQEIDEEANLMEDGGIGSRSAFFQMEFRQHKRDYYIHKLKYKQVTEETLNEQAECYVRAIQWNLHYYYNGCVSWSWYYPHHYAPWITDIKAFSNMKMNFELSKPFMPFEQLLAVLPAASKNLIPPAFQSLMLSDNSPIIDFYPQEFEQDLNGKQQDWEAVVLVPFIDESRLLEAMKAKSTMLTSEEVLRNQHGPMVVCNYSADVLERFPSPKYFPAIELNHCHADLVHREEWNVPINRLRKGLMEGVKLGVFFPGFPTLQYISHTAKLSKSQVRVFEQASRGENMILKLENQGRPDIIDVANALVGKEIWVNWPHMVEAKVVSVSNAKITVRENGITEETSNNFSSISKDIRNVYGTRHGIEIGETEIVVYACSMSGRRYEMAGGNRGRITLEKQWRKDPQPFALQTVVADIPVHNPMFKAYYTVEELFKKGSHAFMLGDPCYGALGVVLDPMDQKHEGRIRLKFTYSADPNLTSVYKKQEELQRTYESAYRAAQCLGLSSHMLSRITGTVFLIRGSREQQPDTMSKINIGLNLKFNKKSEEVCGYTRKQENGWTYSKACIDVMKEYQEKFPELFDFLASNNNVSNDMFHELDIFEEEEKDEKVKELTTWLEQLPTHNAPRQPFNTESLHDEVIKTVEDIISEKTTLKETTMQVRPKLLYLPSSKTGSGLVDPATQFRLFDRVVNIREGFSVPLGLRGILTRIQKGTKPEDNLYDVVFDEEFTGGLSLNCSPGRGYRLPGSALLNISFKEWNQWIPDNGRQKRYNKPRAVVPPYQDPNSSCNYSGAAKITLKSDDSNARHHQQSARQSSYGQGRQDTRKSVPDRVNKNSRIMKSNSYDGSNRNRNERRTVNPLFEEDSNTTDLCPPDPSTLPMPQSFMKGTNTPNKREEDSKSSKVQLTDPTCSDDQSTYIGKLSILSSAQQEKDVGGQKNLMQFLWQSLPDMGGAPGPGTTSPDTGANTAKYQLSTQELHPDQFGGVAAGSHNLIANQFPREGSAVFSRDGAFGRGGVQQFRGHDQARGFSRHGGRGFNPGNTHNEVLQMESDIKAMLNISSTRGLQQTQSQDISYSEAHKSKEQKNAFVPLQVAKRAAVSKEGSSSEERSSHSSSREPEVNPLLEGTGMSSRAGVATAHTEFRATSQSQNRGKSSRRARGRGNSKIKLAANFDVDMK